MDIQAIYFDIDGTLISKQRPRITELTLQSLRTLHSRGIRLCLATGRSPHEIARLGILEQFPFDACLLMGGGYCLDQGRVFRRQPISQADVREIIRALKAGRIACALADLDGLYINYPDRYARQAFDAIHTPLPPVADFECWSDREVYLFNPLAPKDTVMRLMSHTLACACTSWHPYGFDIVPSDSGKDVAMRLYNERHRIPSGATLAFGDGENDAAMLKAAGIGIAMGNADAKLKKTAGYVCSPVDELGITEALRHFGLV